jgi:outer membrane biosynthesis protein TonB
VAVPTPAPSIVERRIEPPVEAPAEVASAVQVVTTTDGGIEYVPRALLSTVPQPTKPLAIPYPREGPAEGQYTTVLALFIDESGAVRRVRLDGPMLPPALDAAARNAFLNARWQPGQVDGRLVKSLIRVEVVFESGRAMQTSRPLD